MSLTTRVLIGLAAGLSAGIAISLHPSPALLALTNVIAPVGTLWMNAIRMTVIPLVVSSLIAGVTAAPDMRSVGRVGFRALLIFLAVLVAGAVFAASVGQPLLAWLPIDASAAAALRESAAKPGATADAAAKIPGFAQWLTDLVPQNPVKAAADGAMLPVIVFTLAFAVALLRVPPSQRQPVAGFFSGVFDAVLVLVRWVLALAPFGVFGLALPLATRLGLSAAGALVYYVVLVSLAAALFSALVLYPAAVLLGGVPLRTFARASAPAQAVAFSSRSSLASLPAMIDSSRSLGLPAEVTTFFLPLAASVFRAGASVGVTIGVLFLARLYGVPLSAVQLATVIVTVVLTSFSVPGIPGGSILVMLPALQAAGIPDAGIGLLLGLDTIPDMFRTTTNVTGHMAAATIVARGHTPEATPPAQG
jgi:proton glutamate symport protein